MKADISQILLGRNLDVSEASLVKEAEGLKSEFDRLNQMFGQMKENDEKGREALKVLDYHEKLF